MEQWTTGQLSDKEPQLRKRHPVNANYLNDYSTIDDYQNKIHICIYILFL